MKLKHDLVFTLLLLVIIFTSDGLAFAADQAQKTPRPIKITKNEKTAPCFIPGVIPAPDSYLQKRSPAWNYINSLYNIKNMCFYGIFETQFQEPVIKASEREKKKETAPNKDDLWRLSPGAAVWADIKPQYVFYLKTQSPIETFANGKDFKFRLHYSKNGKDLETEPTAVVWRKVKPDFNIYLGYSDEGMLYTGIPLSEKIDTFSVEGKGPDFDLISTYHFKYGIVPKYIEKRDDLSGRIEGGLVWPDTPK